MRRIIILLVVILTLTATVAYAATLGFDPHGKPPTKGFVAVEAYKWIRDNVPDGLAGCDKTTDQFADLDQDGVSKFKREAINCLASVGFFDNYPTPDDQPDATSEALGFDPHGKPPTKGFVAVEAYKWIRDNVPDGLAGCDKTTDQFADLDQDGVSKFKREAINCLASVGFFDNYPPPSEDHADTIGKATSVTVGGAVPGVVDYPGDIDVFVFDAREGESYQIDVSLGTLGDSVLVLYDADAWVLAVNDDYGGSLASRVFWTARSSGRYYAEVASLGDGTGSYTLTVAVSDIVDDHAYAISEATSVTVGDAVPGILDYPGDIDLFAFDAREGESYQIDVALGTLGDSVVAVYDADETNLAGNDDYGGSLASRIFWEAPTAGRYYAEVASLGDGTGSYTLTVAVSDIVDDHAYAISDATSVTVGEAVPGVVDYPGDIDLFAFDAVQGKLYQIDVSLGTLGDSAVALYDADGSELAVNDDYGGSLASRVFWTARSSGRYYAEVASFGDGTGSYTLTVAVSDIVDGHADTVAEATSVTAGGAVLGVVDYPGDIDLFAFDAVQGELYQIDVALGTLGDSVVAVYDADETELASNDDYHGSPASRVFWEARSSGRYYVAVASFGDGTGSYTLTIIVR